MTNEQLYLAIGVPMLFNAILILYVNARIEGVNTKIDNLHKSMDERFASVNERFDDMRDLWRAELRRVEEIIDARLKHLEESREYERNEDQLGHAHIERGARLF